MAQASSRSFFHLASTPVAQRIVLCLLLLSSAAGAVASRHRGFVFPVSENGAASVLPATAAAATAEAATAETAAAAAAAPTPAATAEKLLPSRWVSAESARTVAGSVEDGSPVEATAAAVAMEEVRRALSHVPARGFAVFRQLLDERYDEIASALVAPLLAGQPITLLVPTDGCFHPSTRARHPPSAQAEFDVTAREGRSLSETAHEERPMGHEDDVDEEDKASDVAAGGDAAGKGDVARTREVAGFLSAHVMAGAHCHEAMRAAKGSWKMPMLHGGNHVTRITPPNDQSPLHKQHLWNQDGIGFTHSSSHSSSSSSSSNEASTQVATNSVAAAPDAVTDSAAPDVAAGDTAAANAAATMTFSSDVSPGRQAGSRFEWSVVTVPDIFVSKRVVLHGVQHQ
ncbi:unnamed protein product [Closterium sp. NIES-53]